MLELTAMARHHRQTRQSLRPRSPVHSRRARQTHSLALVHPRRARRCTLRMTSILSNITKWPKRRKFVSTNTFKRRSYFITLLHSPPMAIQRQAVHADVPLPSRDSSGRPATITSHGSSWPSSSSSCDVRRELGSCCTSSSSCCSRIRLRISSVCLPRPGWLSVPVNDIFTN